VLKAALAIIAKILDSGNRFRRPVSIGDINESYTEDDPPIEIENGLTSTSLDRNASICAAIFVKTPLSL
jgi:hypothetical protein